MTILLQPVFVDLKTSNVTQHGNDSGENKSETRENTLGLVSHSTAELSEDSLHSMWKVATKVKSVMADGARFENLTWRAWYRKNQLEKFERERRELETPPASGTADTPNSPASSSCSQATAIPRHPSIRAPTYGNGYSSILAEIQEASTRRTSSLMPGASPSDSSSESLLAKAISKSTETPSETSTHSGTSIATTSIKSFRRRKKNVDKFIKRQQQLEQIAEQTEEARTPIKASMLTGARQAPLTTTVSKDAAESRHEKTTSTHGETSSFTTNDTLSGGSIGERQATRPRSDGLTFALRRSEYLAAVSKSSSSSSCERPNVSLLTMLLNRSGTDSRRSESCPPPPIGMSPPMRPGAPIPPQVAAESVPPAATVTIGSSSDSSNTGSKQRPESPPSAVSVSITAATTKLSGNTRRRPAPNPADFTTPLFIW